MLQTIIPYIPHLTQQRGLQPQATPLPLPRVVSSRKELPTVQPPDDLTRFQPELEPAPVGDTIGRCAPTPSASVRSVLDPNTLSSDSTNSLRVQLRLMNQRIDDVRKEVIRSKDDLGESSTGGSPFVPEIREKGFLKTPNPMKSRPRQWDWGRYYHFHRDYGHDTEECYDLKNQIESLIHRGHLSRYVSRASRHPI
ncbi:hypothetical protein GW17_00052718 [Ensete ventricosum]|nr:hypothetical protein GW17_00052718 [Ensete ventricosum]